MTVSVKYDREADAVYVRLDEKPYAYGEDLDPERRVDYATDGTPIGVELLCVSDGVDLRDLPSSSAIAEALKAHRIRVFA